MLADFIMNDEKFSAFVLKGYAGTGKTTIVSALVNILPSLGLKSVLMAPTGKAAKVLANYSKKQAFTIHRKIYLIFTSKDGTVNLTLQENKHINTIFIVDEASMISNEKQAELSLFSTNHILDDLIQYVFNGDNCKLILIGDTAQLPPVKLNVSPALDIDYLKKKYDLHINTIELNEVVRQSVNSGILINATSLRKVISNKQNRKFRFFINEYRDFVRINPSEFQEAIEIAYSQNNIENSVVICRSNKRANLFNQKIRNRILLKESEISAGDLLMVVKNNYFWLPKESKAGFIANGDTIEIIKIFKYYDMYGFRFAKVMIRLADYPDEGGMIIYILLDTMYAESPWLSAENSRKLYEEISKDYAHISNKKEKLQQIKSSPFYNALQVKFAYALTCHKAQGGQWENVFVEQGYLTEDMINHEYYRWLYTAITRASMKLFLVNFNEDFFSNH